MIEKIKSLVKSPKKNILLISICVVLAVLLILYGVLQRKNNPDETVINRGQVAKAVSLLFHSKSEIEKIENTNFKDNEAWYVNYMEMMYKDTYYNKNQIKPIEREITKAFTYGDLDNLFTNMGVVDKKLQSYVKNNKSNEIITQSGWNDIYLDLQKLCDLKGNIKQVKLTVVGTVSNVPAFKPWKAATTMGECGFEGLSLDYYIDKTIEVLMRDNEIITVLDVVEKDVTYYNAWIISVADGKMTAFVEGATREFEVEDKTVTYNNITADLYLENKKLKNYKLKNDFITGKVLSVTDTEINIEGYGKLPLSKDLKIYSLYGELAQKSKNDILIGYDVHRFVISDGMVTSAIIDRAISTLNIRVLLKNSGYTDIYHDNVILCCDGGFTVKYGNNVKMFTDEEKIEFNKDSEYLTEGRLTVLPNNPDSKLFIESIKRNNEGTAYRGNIEVILEEGKLIVINELPLEQYLYYVVPSEMPWSYSEEALKAQAVCARTYAYKHIQNSGYGQYGAHVDDSTSYQVYNTSGEQEATTAAVDATKGIIMTYQGTPISAYFFSTSCGSTTNSSIWNGNIEYVKGVLLTDRDTGLDLTDDSVFDTFIRTGYKTFDSEYPWYRWKVSMSLEEITESVNKNIEGISIANSGNVKLLNEAGEYENAKVVGVGTVKKVEAGTRNTGGVLDYITIYGTENTVRVYKEYNIRKIFDIKDKVIERTNGDDVDTMSMLPSAYILFDNVISDGLLSGYTIVGGGYGHGAGMSQNGANYMAKNGYDYKGILNFFYNDIELKEIY